LKRFIRNRVVLFIIAAWFIYWPVEMIIPTNVLLEFINGMIASMSIGIVTAYMPGAWEVLRRRPYRLSGGDLLMVGATLVQMAIAALFVWGWAYRLLDEPEYMIDHPLRGWIVYALFIGSVLHLMAWEVEEAEHSLPTKGWVHLGAWISAGLGLVVVLLIALKY
jgi:hypothetical protein